MYIKCRKSNYCLFEIRLTTHGDGDEAEGDEKKQDPHGDLKTVENPRWNSLSPWPVAFIFCL